MQLGQRNYAKWANYNLKIDEDILNNVKKFVSIDGARKTNSKSFRLTKNRQSTGVFIENDGDNMNNNILIPDNMEINEQNA